MWGQTDTESAGNARSIISYQLQDAANICMNLVTVGTIIVLKGKRMNLWQYEERFYILADEFQNLGTETKRNNSQMLI